jgi:hypothetical protein
MVPLALAAAGTFSKTFPDVPPTYWAYDAINQVTNPFPTPTDPPLFQGKANGNFDPDSFMTRAQMATVFSRNTTQTASMITEAATKANVMRRGCTACHAIIDAATGKYGLAYEAKNAYAGHPFAATDTKTYQDCMVCHASKQNGLGVGAGISMRDIVHPVHMNSGVYVGEFRGDCFNCHNVDFNNVFQVLPVKVDTADDGIPTSLPIGSAVNPIPAVP